MKNCKKNHEALASQRQTDALFEQVNDIVENAKKFPVLLFFNEAEAHALSVFVRKYNFKGHVKVTKRISKNKQRILKKVGRRLLLPLEGQKMEEQKKMDGSVMGFRGQLCEKIKGRCNSNLKAVNYYINNNQLQ